MPFKGYGSSWLLSSLGGTSSEDSTNDDPQKELNDYLTSQRETTENPIKWWGVRDYYLYLFYMS